MVIVKPFDPRLIDFTLCEDRFTAEIHLQTTLTAVRKCSEIYELWDVLYINGWKKYTIKPKMNDERELSGFFYIHSYNNILYINIYEIGSIIRGNYICYFEIASQAKSRIRELRARTAAAIAGN